MSYFQVPCQHGQLQCATCMPQWRQRGAGRIDQEWQSTASSSGQSSSSTASSTPMPPQQHVPLATEADDAATNPLALTFPSPMQSSAQNRLQIRQRFDDLHMYVRMQPEGLMHSLINWNNLGECQATLAPFSTMNHCILRTPHLSCVQQLQLWILCKSSNR